MPAEVRKRMEVPLMQISWKDWQKLDTLLWFGEHLGWFLKKMFRSIYLEKWKRFIKCLSHARSSIKHLVCIMDSIIITILWMKQLRIVDNPK